MVRQRTWAVRLLAIFAVITAVAALILIVFGRPASTSAPAPDESSTAKLRPLGVCSSPEPSSDATALNEANAIITAREASRYAVARRIYENLLEKDPTNQCAARGLTILSDLEAEQARNPTPAPTWAEAAKRKWDTFVKTLTSPLTDMVLVSAATLILLLVLARLATPVFVRPSTTTPRRVRGWIWLTGLVVLVVASTAPIVVVSFGTVALPGPLAWVIPVAVLLLTLLPLLRVVFARFVAPRRWFVRLIRRGSVAPVQPLRRLVAERGLVTTVTVSVVGMLGLLATLWLGTVTPIGQQNWLAFLASALLAIIGVAWVAFGRGTKLALEVQCSDEAGGKLLLARLRELGSQPPQGIYMPAGADVNTLPESALTAVPAGALAATLFNLIRVVRPGAPWQFNVVLHGDTSLTWTGTRNGVPATEGHQIVTQSDLLLDEASDVGSDDAEAGPAIDASQKKDELLTACAAGILVLLQRSHPVLGNGMCGASRWETLAMQSIAGRTAISAKRKRWMLEAARDFDREYPLARLALINADIPKTPEQRKALAEEATELYREIFDGLAPEAPEQPYHGNRLAPAPRTLVATGYEAVQLRFLFNVAAAWMNVFLDSDPEPRGADRLRGRAGAGWQLSAEALVELTIAWRNAYRHEALERIRKDLRDPMLFLILDLRAYGANLEDPDARVRVLRYALALAATVLEPDTEGAPALGGELARRMDYYARATHKATLASSAPGLQPELDRWPWDADLRLAASGQEWHEWARYDPSFRRYQRAPDADDQAAQQIRFKKLVGDQPPDSYLELKPFTAHAAELKSLGLLDVQQLASLNVQRLAKRARVHPAAARRWIGIARLARAIDTGSPSLTLAVLQLLLALGVESEDELQGRAEDPQFYRELVGAATTSEVVPLRCETVDLWKARLLAWRYVHGIDPQSERRRDGCVPRRSVLLTATSAKCTVRVEATVLQVPVMGSAWIDAEWSTGLLGALAVVYEDDGFMVEHEFGVDGQGGRRTALSLRRRAVSERVPDHN